MSGAGWALIAPALAAHGIAVDDARRARIEEYAALLLHWNRRINLVGATTPETLYTRHVLDCLMLETVPRDAALRRWVDIGAGAGLPGVLVALLHPDYTVTAVESAARKATFLREAARTLGLENLAVHRGDVHALARSPQGAGRFDVAVARAFAALDELMAVGARLLRPGGELWAMKGTRLAEEQARVRRGHAAAFEPVPRTYPYRFAEWGQEGVIAVYRRRA